MGLARIDLRGIGAARDISGNGHGGSALTELAGRMVGVTPALKHGAIAIIDSPRWPVDLDWSKDLLTFRDGEVKGRALDASLQRIVKELRRTGATNLKLSMFPTPRLAYFLSQMALPSCKPHLRAFGRELFGERSLESGSRSGGTFTRFILSGFAAYRALGALRITCYEGYPDLQFRLWAGDRPLPSKMKHADQRDALEMRVRIVEEVARKLGIGGAERVRTLDDADSAILALSLAAEHAGDRGMVVEHPAEGRFRVTIPAAYAELLSFPDD